jgi:hypothetical protein
LREQSDASVNCLIWSQVLGPAFSYVFDKTANNAMNKTNGIATSIAYATTRRPSTAVGSRGAAYAALTRRGS